MSEQPTPAVVLNTVASDKNDITKVVKLDPTEEKKALFLECLGTEKVAGNVLIAAQNAGVNRQYMYKLKGEDPVFSDKWDEVVKFAKNQLRYEVEYALRKSALKGNVAAQIFILKNVAPEAWSDKHVLEGDVPGTTKVTNNQYNYYSVDPKERKSLNDGFREFLKSKNDK